MADRYPGGVIRTTPPTITPPTNGEGGSASGVWTLDAVNQYEKAGVWPKGLARRKIYTFGLNSSAQLGQNDTISRSSPVQVGSATWRTLDASTTHVLATSFSGGLWSWGAGFFGQLGHNQNTTSANLSSPVQVGALTNWSQVAALGSASLALKTDGTIWAWGNGGSGQLGQNDTISRSSPVQVGSLSTWAWVGAANFTSAAIKTDGTLWTWGSNGLGTMGDSTNIAKSSPVQIGALTNWANINGSESTQSMIAVQTNGTLWTWGEDDAGILGHNTVDINANSPVQIGALTNWSFGRMGFRHSAAIKTDGTLWTWGYNAVGQLGDGNTVSKSSPIQVGSLTNWSSVDTGRFHTLATTTDGYLYAFGDNRHGQLGQNNTTNRNSPVQIGALNSWVIPLASGYFSGGARNS